MDSYNIFNCEVGIIADFNNNANIKLIKFNASFKYFV